MLFVAQVSVALRGLLTADKLAGGAIFCTILAARLEVQPVAVLSAVTV
jgi:hypothetical protein